MNRPGESRRLDLVWPAYLKTYLEIVPPAGSSVTLDWRWDAVPALSA
ncbi:MAG: hypothetical protein WCG47_27260 [Dermatophilaceae bacterium]